MQRRQHLRRGRLRTPSRRRCCGNATTRLVYDLDRFQRTQQAHPDDPTVAAGLRRDAGARDPRQRPVPPPGLKIQLSFSYSDGFGREIQKKIQAEPGPVAEGGPAVSPRWVGSGWTIFNNKGKPVRQYEPFFSADARLRVRCRRSASARCCSTTRPGA